MLHSPTATRGGAAPAGRNRHTTTPSHARTPSGQTQPDAALGRVPVAGGSCFVAFPPRERAAGTARPGEARPVDRDAVLERQRRENGILPRAGGLADRHG